MTVIPAHKRERQEDQEFKVRLGNIERPCPKKRNSSNKKKTSVSFISYQNPI
jgi:hypothetical protein